MCHPPIRHRPCRPRRFRKAGPAGAAIHDVIPLTGTQDVVTVATKNGVRAFAAMKLVIARITVENVGPVVAMQLVVTFATIDSVGTCTCDQIVVAHLVHREHWPVHCQRSCSAGRCLFQSPPLTLSAARDAQARRQARN